MGGEALVHPPPCRHSRRGDDCGGQMIHSRRRNVGALAADTVHLPDVDPAALGAIPVRRRFRAAGGLQRVSGPRVRDPPPRRHHWWSRVQGGGEARTGAGHPSVGSRRGICTNPHPRRPPDHALALQARFADRDGTPASGPGTVPGPDPWNPPAARALVLGPPMGRRPRDLAPRVNVDMEHHDRCGWPKRS